MKPSLRKVALIGVVLLFLYVAGNIAWFFLKYSPAEATLREEFGQLSLPADYKMTSLVYRHGQCFDNCPLLRAEYRVDASRETVGRTIKSALQAKNYSITHYFAGDVWGRKQKIRIYTVSEPELQEGTRDYAFSLRQQLQPITKLTVSFEYNP